jgi:hydrogenase maturation protein HypF
MILSDSGAPCPRSGFRRRVALTVRGVVQGIGFRPFVYNAARGCGLSGWVLNRSDAVEIQVEGAGEAIERFLHKLYHEHPPQARIDSLDQREISPRNDPSMRDFEIRTSHEAAPPRPTIPADLATCAACIDEIRSPGQRRRGYAFTNCTNCGPRWSIIEQLPYDRPRTSMRHFPMCDDCRREYQDPQDRRFHAQPIACPVCGPRLRLMDTAGATLCEREAALDAAAAAILQGEILALKGLGGFQLIVDATSEPAVRRLRQRKRRPDKPFALMMADVDGAREYCRIGPEAARELQSPAAPILLLERLP